MPLPCDTATGRSGPRLRSEGSASGSIAHHLSRHMSKSGRPRQDRSVPLEGTHQYEARAAPLRRPVGCPGLCRASPVLRSGGLVRRCDLPIVVAVLRGEYAPRVGVPPRGPGDGLQSVDGLPPAAALPGECRSPDGGQRSASLSRVVINSIQSPLRWTKDHSVHRASVRVPYLKADRVTPNSTQSTPQIELMTTL
jgi:hypothetical protein